MTKPPRLTFYFHALCSSRDLYHNKINKNMIRLYILLLSAESSVELLIPVDFSSFPSSNQELEGESSLKLRIDLGKAYSLVVLYL